MLNLKTEKCGSSSAAYSTLARQKIWGQLHKDISAGSGVVLVQSNLCPKIILIQLNRFTEMKLTDFKIKTFDAVLL